jgi:hypothetical protein
MGRAISIGHASLAGTLLLAMASPAAAVNWFSLDALSATSGMTIEVDTDSLRHTANHRDIAVRITYPQVRFHVEAAYRSVVTTVEFRCDGALGTYRDAVYHADAKGTGAVVAREPGQAQVPERIRQLLPPRSLETLTRAACAQPTPAAR